jgi:hypothetical protein
MGDEAEDTAPAVDRHHDDSVSRQAFTVKGGLRSSRSDGRSATICPTVDPEHHRLFGFGRPFRSPYVKISKWRGFCKAPARNEVGCLDCVSGIRSFAGESQLCNKTSRPSAMNENRLLDPRDSNGCDGGRCSRLNSADVSRRANCCGPRFKRNQRIPQAIDKALIRQCNKS